MQTIKGLAAVGRIISGMLGYCSAQLASQAAEYQHVMVYIMAISGWTCEEVEEQVEEFYRRAVFASRLTAIQWFKAQLIDDIVRGRCDWVEGKATYRRQ